MDLTLLEPDVSIEKIVWFQSFILYHGGDHYKNKESWSLLASACWMVT
jgi:hypothetical protein